MVTWRACDKRAERPSAYAEVVDREDAQIIRADCPEPLAPQVVFITEGHCTILTTTSIPKFSLCSRNEMSTCHLAAD